MVLNDQLVIQSKEIRLEKNEGFVFAEIVAKVENYLEQTDFSRRIP